jgi:hypothetical protein
MPVAQRGLPEGRNRIGVRAEYALKRQFLFYPARFWPDKNHVNLLFALDLLKKDPGLELDIC